MNSGLPTVSVVVLTRGNRPQELSRAVTSALAQESVLAEVIVVGNGWSPVDLPPQVRTVHLPENVGVSGRNFGVPLATGELLFFLDDDAWLPAPDALRRVAELFAEHPRIGMVQTRLVDPAAPEAPRYWVPRLRKGDPARSSTVMYVLEAALAVRRPVFEEVGGFGDFGYAHEGIDLTWRVWDAGYLVWYAGDLVTCHPAIWPTRHAEYQRLNARNRVWLARRNLPWALVPAYLGSWTLVEWSRVRHDAEAWRTWRAGFAEGWRTPAGERRPVSWGTVWELTKHGRPPVI